MRLTSKLVAIALTLLVAFTLLTVLPAPVHAQNRFLSDQLIKDAFVYSSSANGAKTGSAVTVVESGAMPIHHTKFTLASLSVTTADHTTDGGSGGQLIYTFPEGITQILGCTANLTTLEASANITNTAALVGSLGSATDDGDDSLTSTEANIIASMAGTLTSSAGVLQGYGTILALDGHTTANKIYLNLAMPNAASSGAGAVAVSGVITCDWIARADY
jgi:hypothetical protein